ncbi:MAG: SRPBCC family protein [Patescibacteria group bacterium]|jgi:activator of HSP90 ATPase
MAHDKQSSTISIKQGGLIHGTPSQVYELWMDSAKHSALTGSEAKISPSVGGEFTMFGGWATGRNIELNPNKKIIQTWRGEDWPEGHFSTLTVHLLPAPGGTKLLFTQTGVPISLAKSVAKGWNDFYWEPMKKYFTK